MKIENCLVDTSSLLQPANFQQCSTIVQKRFLQYIHILFGTVRLQTMYSAVNYIQLKSDKLNLQCAYSTVSMTMFFLILSAKINKIITSHQYSIALACTVSITLAHEQVLTFNIITLSQIMVSVTYSNPQHVSSSAANQPWIAIFIRGKRKFHQYCIFTKFLKQKKKRTHKNYTVQWAYHRKKKFHQYCIFTKFKKKKTYKHYTLQQACTVRTTVI